jgi:hypothetical protein
MNKKKAAKHQAINALRQSVKPTPVRFIVSHAEPSGTDDMMSVIALALLGRHKRKAEK